MWKGKESPPFLLSMKDILLKHFVTEVCKTQVVTASCRAVTKELAYSLSFVNKQPFNLEQINKMFWSLVSSPVKRGWT